MILTIISLIPLIYVIGFFFSFTLFSGAIPTYDEPVRHLLWFYYIPLLYIEELVDYFKKEEDGVE